MTSTNRIQIAFTTRNGKRKALYRSMMVTGAWMRHWHHVTVRDAETMLRLNSTEKTIGGHGPDCTVELYQKAA